MRFYFTVGYLGSELVCINSPVMANCPINGPRDVNSLLYFTRQEIDKLSKQFSKIEKGKTLDWFRNDANWKEFMLDALGAERYTTYRREEIKANEKAEAQYSKMFKNIGFFMPGKGLLDANGNQIGSKEVPPIIFNPNE